MSDGTKPIQMVALGPDDEAERQEWIAALTRVVDTGAFCLGPEVTALERQVEELLEVPHTLGVSNGTDALKMALQAVGVGAGDEVIVPAYSFFASASMVTALGATPVFVDVDAATLTMDPEAIAPAITERTKAVLPVHLYGQAAAMDRIQAICDPRGLAIVEDAAQVFGIRYRGQALGSLGKAGTFSFYPTKNIGAPGDAGMLVTRDSEVFEQLQLLRVHGDRGGYNHTELGWNARMDGFQGAILQLRVARFAQIQAQRAANAERYLELLQQHGLLGQVRPLGRTPGSDHGWHQFIVRVDDRERVRAALSDQGIPSGIYYPGTLPLQPVFAELGHKPGAFPEAESAAADVLALPVHHRVGAEDVDRVVAALQSAIAS
ncbi:MAG: DegT/DnrJ/EryC1/StrS family aminotransferase [Planctomycetota bacterium]